MVSLVVSVLGFAPFLSRAFKLTVKLICKIALMYAHYYVSLLRTHLSTLGLKQRALTKGVSTTVPLVSCLTRLDSVGSLYTNNIIFSSLVKSNVGSIFLRRVFSVYPTVQSPSFWLTCKYFKSWINQIEPVRVEKRSQKLVWVKFVLFVSTYQWGPVWIKMILQNDFVQQQQQQWNDEMKQSKKSFKVHLKKVI